MESNANRSVVAKMEESVILYQALVDAHQAGQARYVPIDVMEGITEKIAPKSVNVLMGEIVIILLELVLVSISNSFSH